MDRADAGVDLKYGLDDRPPWPELLLFGLQWLAVSLPTIVIIGKVVAVLHFPRYADQIVYLQKVTFVTAAALLCQVLWGHRLPLILGPAAVLLVAVTANQGFPLDTIYSSVLVGGLILAALGATGLFGHLQRLFTPRVVAVVLLLIAFTLTPTVARLIVSGPASASMPQLGFALGLVCAMFVAHKALGRVWRSTLLVWAMALGSVAHFLLLPGTGNEGRAAGVVLVSGFFERFTGALVLQPGVLISFLFCFLALAVNDFGSVQSMQGLLRPPHMARRISRGMTVTGLANALSGFLGVVGLVNFSLSPGIIASTGCASRFTLIPTGLALLALSFSPAAIGWIGAVPPAVVGSILIYVLSAQVAAGLLLVCTSEERLSLDGGLVIGLPVFLGAVIASLPPAALDTFPAALKPILGNGFVVGVVAALLLEHAVFRR